VLHPEDDLRNNGKEQNATVVAETMKNANIKYSSTDNAMTDKNVRMHLKILRRLSVACVSQTNPQYKDSALFFADKIEDVFGRTSGCSAVINHHHVMDQFQSSIHDLADLRIVFENLFTVFLRGYNVKLSHRTASDSARVLLNMNKLPQQLLPKLPAYQALLKPFASLSAFHKHFPVGLDAEGEDIDPDKCPDIPSFSQESLDSLINDILVPMFKNKKYQTLSGKNGPLAMDFVVEVLPTIERNYELECAQRAQTEAGKTNFDEVPVIADDNLTEKEVELYTKQWADWKDNYLGEVASDIIKKNLVPLCWDDSRLLQKVRINNNY
jgi:hypothetical protein